jgi:signal transduction histidine kinase
MRWRPRPSAWRGVDPRLFDAVLALVFVVIAQVSVWTDWEDLAGTEDGPVVVRAAIALTYTAPLAWRRRFPLPVVVVMAAGVASQVLFVEPAASFFGGYVPILIATYSVAAYRPLREASAGLAAAITGVLIVSLRVGELRSPAEMVFEVLTLTAIWLVGRGMYRRGARADALSDHVRSLQQQARDAVVAERARIARELHDVVAHSVSVMGVQAGAAEQMLAVDPERAREPLRAIQSGAREAIAELRLLLGVLRNDDDVPDLDPQPGLAELEALVAQMGRAGLTARLTIEGRAQPLSAGVELSAYRIVQEALTNTLKHAGDADADVTIRHGPAALELEVVDTGNGNGNGDRAFAGHGLIGMRERVALHGGTITTGRRAEGGYAVRARIPLDPGRT